VIAARLGRTGGHAPETEIARDLTRRGLLLAPIALLITAIGWGLSGVASSSYALAIVLANFLLAAGSMAWAARISLHVLMATVLAGYIVRLGLIVLAVLPVANSGWFQPIAFGFTLISAHLILLFWETRYVSASLAFPALKPFSPRALAGGQRRN
jgi:hypothetical protein